MIANSHGQGMYLNIRQFRPVHQSHIRLNPPELRGCLGFMLSLNIFICGLFDDAASTSNYIFIASNDMTINNELERICNEVVVVQFMVLFRQLPRGRNKESRV
jgi:hypothetical protein